MSPNLLLAVLCMAPVFESGLCFAAPGGELLAASAYLTAGDYDRARAAFVQQARTDRQCAEALVGIGAADLRAGRPQEAARAFRDAVAIDPNLACAHMGAGTALCLLGDFGPAMGRYRSAVVSGARRPSLALAGEAYAACALGLYDTALQQARAALGTDPDQRLARYVFAAAALARGDPRPAGELDGARSPGGSRYAGGISLESCLLSPRVEYSRRHAQQDQDRLVALGDLRMLQRTTHTVAPVAVPQVADFGLVSPTQGQLIEGAVAVEVLVESELVLDHIIVLVNDSFGGIAQFQPYKVTLDSRLFADGLSEFRAEGYDAQGRVIRTANVVANIRNGRRTLAPAELEARRAVAELLEESLAPTVSEPVIRQLAGHGLLGVGRPGDAAAALEAAYALDARTPGLRTDLLLAYDSLGLDVGPIAREIHTLPSHNRSVALTFDDGPHPLITPWILDQLDKENVKATFFLVGKQATLYPELVREIRRRGHQVGSHSYSHYSLRHLTPVECEQDLVKSRLAIREACGDTVTLFRPPGGYYDATVRRAAGVLGFATVFWTANVTSFPGQDGKRIAAELARQCARGGIILLHNGEDETLDVLPHLVPELRKRGVTFVTIGATDSAPASSASPARGGA